MDAVMMPLSDVLDGWMPGSEDPPWTWDDEERALHSHPCPTEYARARGTDVGPCHDPEPGCYQRALEAWLAEQGRVTQPVCLGPDGRVWDGHHRIVAARRLGFTEVPVEPDEFTPWHWRIGYDNDPIERGGTLDVGPLSVEWFLNTSAFTPPPRRNVFKSL